MSTPVIETPASVTPTPTPPPVAPGPPAAPPVPTPVVVPSDGAPVDGADDVTITSTTDTQEDVQAALEHKTPDPAAKVPPTEPVVPKVEPAVPAVGDPAVAEAARTLGKRGKTLQQRIDEVVFEREEERREKEAHAADNARLRAENEALKAGKPVPGAAPATAKPAEIPPKPTLKDFEAEPDPYAAWTEALTDWKADRASEKVRAELEGKIATDRKADQDRFADAAAATEHAQVMTAFGTRTAAFRDAVGAEKYDTIVKQIKQEMADGTREDQVYPHLMQIHVTRSEMGPALIYHFAQHPDDFREIAAMADAKPGPMLVALGRLEAKLESTLPIAGKTVPATPTTPAARAVDALASSSIAAAPVSTAPPPPTLVGSAPTATTVPLEEQDYQTFKATRNAQDRRRR